MKNQYLIKFPILILLINLLVSCSLKNDVIAPPNTPSGTFTGQFTYLHLHSATGKIDTLKANLQLTMDTKTGFKISGDTTTLHAGSYGSFIFGSGYTQIQFIDVTFPSTGKPTKIHLSGIYNYSYDGSSFKFLANGLLDTTSYRYNFTKTSN
jgi:hypothetical protein